jgi:hypothetical protein
VIVSQVVPPVESHATAVLKYREALVHAFPGEKPDAVSMEAFFMASTLIEGLRRAGPALDTERLIDALETIRGLDLGIGTPVAFAPAEHQALHRVWGTELDEGGRYRVIDLE